MISYIERIQSRLGLSNIFKDYIETIEGIEENRNEENYYKTTYFIILLKILNSNANNTDEILDLINNYLEKAYKYKEYKVYFDNILFLKKILYNYSNSDKNLVAYILFGTNFTTEFKEIYLKTLNSLNPNLDIVVLLDKFEEISNHNSIAFLQINAHQCQDGFKLNNKGIILKDYLQQQFNNSKINVVGEFWCRADTNHIDTKFETQIIVHPKILDFKDKNDLPFGNTIVDVRCVLFGFGFMAGLGKTDVISSYKVGQIFEGIASDDLLLSDFDYFYNEYA